MNQSLRSCVHVPDVVGNAVACYECIGSGIFEIQICHLALWVVGLGGEGDRFSDGLRRLQQAALQRATGSRNFFNLLPILVMTAKRRSHIVRRPSGERGRQGEHEKERERERETDREIEREREERERERVRERERGREMWRERERKTRRAECTGRRRMAK